MMGQPVIVGIRIAIEQTWKSLLLRCDWGITGGSTSPVPATLYSFILSIGMRIVDDEGGDTSAENTDCGNSAAAYGDETNAAFSVIVLGNVWTRRR